MLILTGSTGLTGLFSQRCDYSRKKFQERLLKKHSIYLICHVKKQIREIDILAQIFEPVFCSFSNAFRSPYGSISPVVNIFEYFRNSFLD